MPRRVKVVLMSSAAFALAAGAAACGTQNLTVPKSDSALHQGAVLFSQRCSGCHTLSYAATRGSAANVRSAQYNNGPNFNTRCERPVIRVLYAIQNGGFSGAIMPQNIVVGQDAINVAQFVAKYAGRQVPHVTGLQPCDSKSIGPIPPPPSNPTAPSPNPTATAAAATTTSTSTSSASGNGNGGKAKKK